MKKWITSLLTLVLLMSLLVVPEAKTSYDYKSLAFKDYYGNTFTFDKAAVGYGVSLCWDGISVTQTGKEEIYPLIILKDNSQVTVSGLSSMSSREGVANLQNWSVYEKVSISYSGNSSFESGSVNHIINTDEDAVMVCVYPQNDTTGNMIFLTLESYLPQLKVTDPGPSIDILLNATETSAQQKPASTQYQSTAKLTGAMIVDMDYNSFNVTVTNPTNTLDRGTVALVLASDEATVHFIDYEVTPNSSRTYSVGAIGHMGSISNYLELISGVEKYLNATIITFESDEDVADFKASIPHEARGHHYDNFLSQNDDYGAITVCFGAPGDTWLKMVGISRKSAPYLYSDDNHNQCKA